MDMLSAKLTKKTNNMIEYLIKSYHKIYVDDYNEGESDFVSAYNLSSRIYAEDIKSAIELYFNNYLHYDFNYEQLGIDENIEYVWYDVLVDYENDAATDSQINRWRKGEFKLYNNHIKIELYEVTPVKIQDQHEY
jgi:hypothetical protein